LIASGAEWACTCLTHRACNSGKRAPR
jgi:hypothetical protein